MKDVHNICNVTCNIPEISVYGKDGVGVKSIEQTKTSTVSHGENEITITLTDGTENKFIVRNGERGEQGIQGIQGIKGDKGEQGIQGIQGVQGVQGIQGEKGDRGIGIWSVEQTKTSTESSGENEVTVTLTNGIKNTFIVTNGAKGEKGEKGDQGIKGEKGDKGDSITMFPNVTIFGQPTIQESQISNFSVDNYLQFPFIVDFANRPWQLDFSFTTGADVSIQHNIFDSNFGLALAVKNSKFVLAMSTNGESWNLGANNGTHTLKSKSTYYVRITWDGAIYNLSYSTDKTTYTTDIEVNSSDTLAPKQIVIGKDLAGQYIFNGYINMADARLAISGKIVWEGMDDAGLATRLAIDLSNIDLEGVNKINSIVNDGFIGQKVIELDEKVKELYDEYAIYGVIIDETVANPQLARCGNMDYHRTLPIQNLMKRCLLLDDGTVNYYLNPDDSTKKADGTDAVLDGTDGQVMVEIPKHYRRLMWMDKNRYRVDISLYPFGGAVEVPKMYVSAFEAAYDKAGNKLASVINMSDNYRGGNPVNAPYYDGTYKDMHGMPTSSISLNTARERSRNRGEGWECYLYQAHLAIYWLYVIEYANLNCQLEFNPTLTSEGFKQGGLGDGVTNMTGAGWSTYNSSQAFIKCGHTLSLGNNTGIVPFAFNEEQAAVYGSDYSCNVPSYRGVENPFGHLAKWVDGVLCNVTEDKRQIVYKCNNSNDFGDISKYYEVCEMFSNSRVIQTIIANADADIFGVTSQTVSIYYFCDKVEANVNGGLGLRGILFGGFSLSGTSGGLASQYTNYAPTGMLTNFGTRLTYLKK